MLSLVLLSGAGLLVLGAASVASALADAEARAVRDARRAAEATAQDLRRVLLASGAVLAAESGFRFEVRDGRVVEPPEIADLPGSDDDPVDRLPLFMRRALEAIEQDEGAVARLAAGARGLADPAQSEVQARLAWYAHRHGDPDARSSRVDAIVGRSEAGSPISAASVVSILLLSATAGSKVSDSLLSLAPRLDDERATGLAARLRDLGMAEAANDLEAAHARIAALRAALAIAGRAMSAFETAIAPAAAGVDGRLCLFDPSLGIGVVLEPERYVGRLRAGHDLVVPWSGSLLVGGPLRDGDVRVVPDVLAIRPEAPRIDRSAAIGFALVLTACSALFVGGLLATRRAIRRESAALHARADFLTSVTHELKTPLAAVRLLAERLHEGRVRDGDRQREYFALLAGETARLGVLIENVLDLGRMERGERSYDRRVEVLDDVVRDAVAVLAPLARTDGMTIEVALAADGVSGPVDRGALVQLVVNLLDNARKYARDGMRIEVSSCHGVDGYLLTVRDFGGGVPPGEQESIFERFVRGARHRDGSIAGVGLGLHLGRELARAHAGTLTCVAPPAGPGAEFRLRLPVVSADVPARVDPRPRDEEGPA